MLSFRYSGRYLFCYFIHLSVFYRIGSQNDSLGFFCLVLLGTYLLCIDDDVHIVEKKFPLSFSCPTYALNDAATTTLHAGILILQELK